MPFNAFNLIEYSSEGEIITQFIHLMEEQKHDSLLLE